MLTNNSTVNYENDFYAWLMSNARLMRQGRLSEIDVSNIAEELESMGRSEKRELINRLSVLLAHLLKWRFEPQRRGKSWEYTIKEQRRTIMRLLKASPSLKHDLNEAFRDAYETAVLKAAKETKLDEKSFPADCPFSLKESMDYDFYPSAIT